MTVTKGDSQDPSESIVSGCTTVDFGVMKLEYSGVDIDNDDYERINGVMSA